MLLHRDDPAKDPLIGNIKVTRQDWMNAALAVLKSGGVEAVKVADLAAQLQVSRSSFYWYFKNRTDLLDALLAHWEATNTAALVAQAHAPAQTITEACCNIFRCNIDTRLFDPQLDFAIRDWARRS
ncbi:MAG: TetR/AcrR family transcriptional regulator, partial [Pseudomonadota bacterium]